MTYLLDTQILLWATFTPEFLTPIATQLLRDESNRFYFSTISIWEVAIKFMKRPDVFRVNPSALRAVLAEWRLDELKLTSRQAIATTTLPLHHHDPFDRILLAQALVENIPLVTADRQLASYDVPLLYVG